MPSLNELIPASHRKAVYLVFGALGALLTAAVAGFGAAGLPTPTYLVVAGAVYASLGASFGLLAASNTPRRVEEDAEFDSAEWDEYVAGLVPVLEDAPESGEAPGDDYDLDERLS